MVVVLNHRLREARVRVAENAMYDAGWSQLEDDNSHLFVLVDYTVSLFPQWQSDCPLREALQRKRPVSFFTWRVGTKSCIFRD